MSEGQDEAPLDGPDGPTRADAHADRLSGEEHRVRNVLAVIRSVFARTVATAASPEDAADHFRGRLDAIARHHAGSALAHADGIDLEDLIRDELLTVCVQEDARVAIEGPPVRLDPRHAAAFGLTVHELATNSVKFGVLSDGFDRGRLRISWDLAGRSLRWEWAETGVPVIAAAPLRRGFGREYVEDALPYQIDAATSFDLAPGGVTCAIMVALPTVPERDSP